MVFIGVLPYQTEACYVEFNIFRVIGLNFFIFTVLLGISRAAVL